MSILEIIWNTNWTAYSIAARVKKKLCNNNIIIKERKFGM